MLQMLSSSISTIVALCFSDYFILYGMQRDLTPPFVDDGLLEIVGFRNAWHGLVMLAPKGHGTRLAQVYTVVI